MSEQKKILLLEDRPGRQSQFLSENQIAFLNKIENVVVPKADGCVSFFEDINNKKVNLNEFDLIIVHKTSLNQDGLVFLKELKKALILFSGGLSQTVFQNEDFPVLSINSADLYNANFIDFLKKYVEGKVEYLTELVYGDRWKLSILLQYRMIKTKVEKESDEGTKTELEENLLKPLEKNFESFPDDIDKVIDKQILAI
jgi:hypothetical protein